MDRIIKLPFALEPYRKQIESTIKPYAQIQTQVCRDTSLWQSKFLGRPYLPKHKSFPRTAEGDYLYLLAQINFAEVPFLEGFPKEGILQIYLENEYGYGQDPEHLNRQNGFRLIYYPEPTLNESELTTNFEFMPSPWEDDSGRMPFEVYSKYLQKPNSCLYLTFQHKLMPMSVDDYQYNKTVGFDPFSLSSSPDDEKSRAVDFYCDTFHGHRLGGYPTFTQRDPRRDLQKEEEPYILLLQIDSEDNGKIDIRWGDLGVCNFFIRQSALDRLDFSDVLYHWDCS